MKLGTAWFGFRKQTASNYFEMAAALGVRYAEIPLKQGLLGMGRPRFQNIVSKQDIDTLQSLSKTAGIRMVTSVSDLELAGTFDVRGNEIDASVLAFFNATARRVIELGSQLGLEVLRITEPNVPPERMGEGHEYMLAHGRALRPLAEYAAANNVCVAVENYGLTSEQVNWLLDEADHPAVGTLYDPCNYYRIGEDPLDALKNLGDRVFYCHLKDAFRHDSRNPDENIQVSRWPPSVAVGEGEIEWGPILVELATFYTGYLCFEYEIAEDVMRGTRQSIEHIRQVAAEHGVDLET